MRHRGAECHFDSSDHQMTPTPASRRRRRTQMAQQATESKNAIAYCKIFPPIGIARVGDSVDPEGWFIGPEFSGHEAWKQPGFTFRDSTGCIKRQGARFRIFGFGEDDKVVGELTA